MGRYPNNFKPQIFVPHTFEKARPEVEVVGLRGSGRSGNKRVMDCEAIGEEGDYRINYRIECDN